MPESPGGLGASPTGRRCPLCQPHPAGGFGRTEEAPMLTASVTAGASREVGRLITNPRVMGGCHPVLRSPLGGHQLQGWGLCGEGHPAELLEPLKLLSGAFAPLGEPPLQGLAPGSSNVLWVTQAGRAGAAGEEVHQAGTEAGPWGEEACQSLPRDPGSSPGPELGPRYPLPTLLPPPQSVEERAEDVEPLQVSLLTHLLEWKPRTHLAGVC